MESDSHFLRDASESVSDVVGALTRARTEDSSATSSAITSALTFWKGLSCFPPFSPIQPHAVCLDRV